MDAGVMLTTAKPDHWTETEVFDHSMDFAVRADELGYQSAWLLEHHFTPYGVCPNTLTMAGYVLGRTRQIKVGTAVAVLPLDHPIRFAEQTSLLDQLSHGRFILGVGRGFFPKDYAAFQVDPARTHEMQREWVEIIRQIWRRGTAEWDSELISLPDVRPAPAPYTRPEPMLYTVGQSPSTIEWAASKGIPLLMPVLGSLEAMRAIVDLYAEAAQEHGVDPDSVPHIMCSVAHVADSLELAREEIVENIRWWETEQAEVAFTADQLAKLPNYRYQHGELQAALLRGGRSAADVADQLLDNCIMGGPDECVHRLEQIMEATGVRRFNLGFEATLDRDRILRTMETFASDVLPRVGWKPAVGASA